MSQSYEDIAARKAKLTTVRVTLCYQLQKTDHGYSSGPDDLQAMWADLSHTWIPFFLFVILISVLAQVDFNFQLSYFSKKS